MSRSTYLVSTLFITLAASLAYVAYTTTREIRALHENADATKSAHEAELAQLRNELSTTRNALTGLESLLGKTSTDLESARTTILENQSRADAFAEKALQNLTTIETDLEHEKATKAITIQGSDLTAYLTSVVQIVCKISDTQASNGSGILWKSETLGNVVLTNNHVIEDAKSCVAHVVARTGTTTAIFALDLTRSILKPKSDTALVPLSTSALTNTTSAASLNYTAAALPHCTASIQTAAPIVVIGFPAYARGTGTTYFPTIGTTSNIGRTTTNGIVSGFDGSTALAYENYFVSAKIDSGNSGGLALAKDSHGLCFLGLPTWLSLGRYESQGLILNSKNILQ